MKPCRLILGAVALAVPWIASAAPSDSTFAVRPVTLVVPFTAGSGIDIIARTIAPRLSERLKQPVVVDNKAGASGNIGADQVAKSPADGYTLMVTVNTFTITPALYKSLPYDPVKDFAPIARMTIGNLALAINPSAVPVSSFDELVAYVRARPGQLNYGSPGKGTPQHLAMEILKNHLKLDIVHVPYKGAAGASTDLMSGQIQMMVLPVHTALPLAATGKVRILGVSGQKRSELAPDVASFGELGLESLDIDMYYWLAAPAGTPAAIVDELNRHAAAIIGLPDVRETLLKQGMVPTSSSPGELSEMIARDVARWKAFIAENGIVAD
ncbi:tripartite tricarboxylate transporter substrate binding protein [Pigmentiphaga sp.]|uniref:Bug family tripartite tricarboxylate transporter substrate binding protein n=1 Tax=Pigmentiphaga sp. TaxID=1977564 RepID=UPI0025CC26FE|nr:tripartite tricarboxylate transporter substrate binding protein [Pigmentiphaga sp.]MBX6319698.1 tripartite tricarboxylate transporter substrate binding protein [Pigmentiphaga sp.]